MTTQRAQPIGDYMWQRGYETAFEEMKPLIEAARAYRDAHAHQVTEGGWRHAPDAVVVATFDARNALLEAARTLEGHVEEGTAQ